MPIVVGEEGDELFVPDQDGMIVPHDETRRLLDANPMARGLASGALGGSGGVGQVNVNLTIDAGSSDLDRVLLQVLRKAVRNTGGNLDVVYRR